MPRALLLWERHGRGRRTDDAAHVRIVDGITTIANADTQNIPKSRFYWKMRSSGVGHYINAPMHLLCELK